MTHDEMIAVIQSAKEGKHIQYRVSSSDNGWTDCIGRTFNFNFAHWAYRIKPTIKYQYVVQNVYGETMLTCEFYSEKPEARMGAMVICRADWTRREE